MKRDLSIWITNIAKSPTNLIRQNNQNVKDEDFYAGTAYREEIYIGISQLWLLYSASILLSGRYCCWIWRKT
ncbi:hypothetical protein F5Y10DRAFT_243522 [Nemania abortiva]|nr:hypothetical protein F5Y10DRAFT_243522 [Nemania abortiva]